MPSAKKKPRSAIRDLRGLRRLVVQSGERKRQKKPGGQRGMDLTSVVALSHPRNSQADAEAEKEAEKAAELSEPSQSRVADS